MVSKKQVLRLFSALMAFALILSGFCVAHADGVLSFLKPDSFNKGIKMLSGDESIQKEQLFELKEHFENGRDERSADYAALVNAILENDAFSAAELAIELVKKDTESGVGLERWQGIIMENISQDPASLDDWLARHYISRLFSDELNGKLELDEELIVKVTDENDTTMDNLPANEEDFGLESVEMLFDSTAAADGCKVLIVQSNQKAKGRSYAVPSKIMSTLPIELLPQNAEDIDYIIELIYCHDYVGDYYTQLWQSTDKSAYQERGSVAFYRADGLCHSFYGEIIGPEPKTHVSSEIDDSRISGGAPALGDELYFHLDRVVNFWDDYPEFLIDEIDIEFYDSNYDEIQDYKFSHLR